MININRVAKVVKGGRRFSFSAIVTVGDGKGRVGVSMGKANEIADAIRKGGENARAAMMTVPLLNDTIPYQVIGRFGASRVLLKPATPGTGVIAAGGVRSILEAAGVRNILTKQLGSRNPNNVVKATVDGLKQLRKVEDIAAKRGLTVPEVLGIVEPGQPRPPKAEAQAAAAPTAEAPATEAAPEAAPETETGTGTGTATEEEASSDE